MTTQDRPTRAPRAQRLPADDPTIFERDLAGLRRLRHGLRSPAGDRRPGQAPALSAGNGRASEEALDTAGPPGATRRGKARS